MGPYLSDVSYAAELDHHARVHPQLAIDNIASVSVGVAVVPADQATNAHMRAAVGSIATFGVDGIGIKYRKELNIFKS